MIYGLDVHKEFIQVCALGAKGSKHKEYWPISASAVQANDRPGNTPRACP